MTRHQVIYTSCKRGIDGVNDGQQIYSYDRDFKKIDGDEVRRLFSYNIPDLALGQAMDEDLAKDQPQAFTYRLLENGMAAIALNTYLGRDYMGEAGRFGNFLSHVVVFDKEDFKTYPIEFLGSDMLRESMDFDEVNLDQAPDFLPSPELEKGCAVDIDKVRDFLAMDNNMDILKEMVFATLTYNDDKKRLVILDQRGNIPLWIGAIEYTLPLALALNINFTTYEYNPALSRSQICGVVAEGTRFDRMDKANYHVFDILENSYPTFEKDKAFFDFLSIAMDFSFDSLKSFHDFLIEGFAYDRADLDIIKAYKFYSLLTGKLERLDESDIEDGLYFAEKFGTLNKKKSAAKIIAKDSANLAKTTRPIFNSLMDFAGKYMDADDAEGLSAIMLSRVLGDFAREDKNTFFKSFEIGERFFQKQGKNLTKQILANKDIYKLIDENIENWQLEFIISKVIEIFKEKDLGAYDLSFETDAGSIFYQILDPIYKKDETKGFFAIEKTLDGFADRQEYLLNMALNIEGIIRDGENSDRDLEKLWAYTDRVLTSKYLSEIDQSFDILLENNYYDRSQELYFRVLDDLETPARIENFFYHHVKTAVLENKPYEDAYLDEFIRDYYRRIVSFGDNFETELTFFYFLWEKDFYEDLQTRLIKDLVGQLDYDKLNEKESNLIKNLFNKYDSKKIDDKSYKKVLVLVLALEIEKKNDKTSLLDALDLLIEKGHKGRYKIDDMDQGDIESYFAWNFGNINSFDLDLDYLKKYYSLFALDEEKMSAIIYIHLGTLMEYVDKARDIFFFVEPLGLVMESEDDDLLDDIVNLFEKVKKAKLKGLDEMMQKKYRENIENWDYIYENASQSSFSKKIKGFGSLFGGRK